MRMHFTVLFHGRIFSLQAPSAEYEFVKLDDYRGAVAKRNPSCSRSTVWNLLNGVTVHPAHAAKFEGIQQVLLVVEKCYQGNRPLMINTKGDVPSGR